MALHAVSMSPLGRSDPAWAATAHSRTLLSSGSLQTVIRSVGSITVQSLSRRCRISVTSSPEYSKRSRRTRLSSSRSGFDVWTSNKPADARRKASLGTPPNSKAEMKMLVSKMTVIT